MALALALACVIAVTIAGIGVTNPITALGTIFFCSMSQSWLVYQ